MSKRIDRREFIGRSAFAGAILAGAYVNPGKAAPSKSPNEKLNIACVGTQNRAWADISGTMSENHVALCDVDQRYLDKATKMLTGQHKKIKPRQYRDFRKMLETEEKNIDAVVVGAAEHIHATASGMALRMGKHVY